MKYLVINGFNVNTEKNYTRVWGTKVKNDYHSSHGKEQDDVYISTSILQLKDEDCGHVLDCEFNKGGYVINAIVIK